MINELEEESRRRLQSAYEAIQIIDTSGCPKSAERDYQLELIRLLKQERGISINVSTDQRVAGILIESGYSFKEVEFAIMKNSPMAVKPTQEQRQFYAKSIAQKAVAPKSRRHIQQTNQFQSELSVRNYTNRAYEMPREEKFFIRPNYTPHEIQAAIASLFRIPKNSILVYNSDEQDMPILNNDVLFLVNSSSAFGDFPCYIVIYPRLPTLDEWSPHDPKRLAFISQFCALLSCEALAEYDDNPDLARGWIIFRRDGTRQGVILDSEKLVDDDSFVIQSTAGDIL
jgi:hypothetical protein